MTRIENYGDDRLILVDVETFGLNPATDPILEVGFRIIDRNFELIDEKNWLVWDIDYHDRQSALHLAAINGDETAEFVYHMHRENNLFDECISSGFNILDMESSICDWLSGHGVRDQLEPMVGSSIGALDRPVLQHYMPAVDALFSYRSIDISSIKEMCRRFNPDVYAKIDDNSLNRKIHRVLPDCEDSASELKFYADNFLYIDFTDLL